MTHGRDAARSRPPSPRRTTFPIERGDVVVHRPQLGRRRHAAVAVGSRDLPRADLRHPGAVLPHLEDVGRGDHRPGRRARRSRSASTRCSASRSRPAAVIGFLTILVVRAVRHDRRVRQDPREYERGRRGLGRTFGESVNLAVNQTLIRSINTTVVAILPTGAILFIGAFVARRADADRHLAVDLRRNDLSARTRRSSSPRRCTRCCARTSRRSRHDARGASPHASGRATPA